MALKLKKDIKKSSYYVWFLGAKESKGLRGSEFVRPVIENLEEREKDVEPFKVTLQVSHKGLKIIQNVVSQNAKSKPKNETIKHFIPHNTITCVHQKEDIIACILLLFNPVTKCPLHVHAYRCDSLETATLLKTQLQTLIERPENQKKFQEIEGRLSRPQKESKKFDSSVGSDTGTSTRESESSEERFNTVATLYDSVAAELRAKLNKNDVPILLPPRDYDTVHRAKGNLTGIELRRCLNTNIVGQNVKARRIESSGGSSGIGSDHAPSPESPDVNDRYPAIDGHSTSDDDWNGDNETTLYLMDVVPETKYDYRTEQRKPRQFDQKASRQHLEEHIKKRLAQQQYEAAARSRMERYQDEDYGNYKIPVPKTRQKYPYREEEEFGKQRSLASSRQRSPSPQPRFEEVKVSPRDRFKDAKEKFLLLERERLEQEVKRKETPVAKERKYYDDYKDENDHHHNNNHHNGNHHDIHLNDNHHDDYNRNDYKRNDYKCDEFKRDDYKRESEYNRDKRENKRQENEFKRQENDYKRHEIDYKRQENDYKRQDGDYKRQDADYKRQDADYKRQDGDYKRQDGDYKRQDGDYKRQDGDFKRQEAELKRQEEYKRQDKRQDDYKRQEDYKRQDDYKRQEQPISPVHKEKPFIKRHESMNYNKEFERYNYDREFEERFESPKPAPRSLHRDEVRYRRDVPLDRYRQPTDKFDPKRRSMFNLTSDDHKKNSLEIARELKRRSYLERDERDYSFSKSSVDLDQIGGGGGAKYVKNPKPKTPNGYRNSYAEPKYRVEKPGKKFEVLHRTNSSVSNQGRVGIASVHPY